MNNLVKTFHAIGLSTVFTLLFSPAASAHFMVAQHGTLNFVDDSIFLVLSVPVTAFMLEDTDGDGGISMIEFNTQRIPVVKTIRQQIVLSDAETEFTLQGLMLSPELDHHSAKEKLSQIVVLGKYSVPETVGDLYFETNLFGKYPDEKKLEIKASRKSSNLSQELVLTPGNTVELLDAELTGG